ncbi:hypothetical protein TRVL_07194 [Trypanosoma vivax]|nr:hypothetical protein TRVL_07194 [Trypanosoma vivax]
MRIDMAYVKLRLAWFTASLAHSRRSSTAKARRTPRGRRKLRTHLGRRSSCALWGQPAPAASFPWNAAGSWWKTAAGARAPRAEACPFGRFSLAQRASSSRQCNPPRSRAAWCPEAAPRT